MKKNKAPGNEEAESLRVHRFRDYVALNASPYGKKNRTVYLSAEQADALGDALKAYALDVQTKAFLQSGIGTTVVFDAYPDLDDIADPCDARR